MKKLNLESEKDEDQANVSWDEIYSSDQSYFFRNNFNRNKSMERLAQLHPFFVIVSISHLK